MRDLTIDDKNQRKESPYSLAKIEDVDHDALRKRFTEDTGKDPYETKSIEEMEFDETTEEATLFAEFFELEGDEFADEDPGSSLRKMQESVSENEEEFEDAEKSAEEIKRMDADEGVIQAEISEFDTNEDPLLEQEFKEKSERMIKKMVVEDSKQDRPHTSPGTGGAERIIDKETPFTSTRSSYSSSSPFGEDDSFRRSTTNSNSSSNKSTVYNKEGRDKQVAFQYSEGATMMANMAHYAPKTSKTKRKKSFFKRRHWNWKSVTKDLAEVFQTDKARMMMKVGAMLSLQMSMAIVSKRYEFDNSKQMLTYLGLMMGVFYIGHELSNEGLDPRRMQMI